ncbi:hypothetical protein E8D34_07335 [Nocardioides sp. GY 10113]|uniref:LuxR C-terminal-related transcriptional regulator n=1 Tax=Nocardioides sp. GY 10113 TaxID=2569761 RepID=UPI0010A8DCFB|nr:LuxR C-terminal-related transcriptional regulator [Nocardioides sp. GY 10113]TIC88090.1 hypothetical protein E8D34_07335 [Nocardioides sp. GY 10113]
MDQSAEQVTTGSRLPGSALFLAKLRPPASVHLVQRPRLLDLLEDALASPIVVVSAPAGSGKTALLASWAAQTALPCAWLSLDEWDRDPVRLWTGLLASVDTVVPGVATSARAVLTRRGRLDEVVATLLGDLEAAALDAAVLVLDDVHLIDDVPEAVRSLAMLAAYLPEGLRLVLIGRRRPGLPVDRLRAQGRLREVSFAELQFSDEEAAAMLRRLAPEIGEDELATTTERAAGWAASLQLSGLAARAARARSGEPRGSDAERLTDDYLWHDVLADEAAPVLDVMRAAAVVDRIDADLARALTGRRDAGEVLESACDRGLFLTRLSQPGWYAQHELVRRLVERDLGARDQEACRRMHARAAEWYDEAGEPALAVRHWLRADRPRQALRSVAVNNGTLYDEGRESVVVQAVAQVPSEVVAGDLDAALDYAWAHVVVDRRVLLDTVDRIAELAARRDLDDRTRGRIGFMEAVAALHRGEWAAVPECAEAALAHFGARPWSDTLGRFGWNVLARGVALTERWDDEAPLVRRAHRMVAVDRPRQLAFEGTRALGLALGGRPLEALAVAADTEDHAHVASMSILSLELSLAEAVSHRERGERDRARTLLAGLAGRPTTPLPYVPFRAALELAECDVATGRPEDAERRLAAARSLMVDGFAGPGATAWVETVEVVVAVAAGDPGRAEEAARRITEPTWRAIGLARTHLGRGDRAAAAADLPGPVGVPEGSVRQRVLVDLLRARAASGEEAREALCRAARLASEHGLVQTVAAECSPATGLLDRLERVADVVPEAWLQQVRHGAAQDALGGSEVAAAQALTERERDVLRMLPSRLTVGEIADELHLSRNTVKFHLKVIYRKLGCGSRAEAAAVARRLGRVRRD